MSRRDVVRHTSPILPMARERAVSLGGSHQTGWLVEELGAIMGRAASGHRGSVVWAYNAIIAALRVGGAINTRPTRRSWRRRVVPAAQVVAVFAVVSLTGCSGGPGGTTTCREYAQMSPTTGLMSDLTADQTKVVRDMLDQNNRQSDVTSVSMATLQIIQYCNIYGGRSGSNRDQPISNIPGLR